MRARNGVAGEGVEWRGNGCGVVKEWNEGWKMEYYFGTDFDCLGLYVDLTTDFCVSSVQTASCGISSDSPQCE